MLFGKYHFICHLETESHLPSYKGSTFRGVFGRALKRVVCALKLEECGKCLLKERCLYMEVFETKTSPHPFVIEPPLSNETYLSAGSSFAFDLLLFGQVNDSLPYFIYAFKEMGKIGIGRKVNGQRGKFSLDEVLNEDTVIYSASSETISRVKLAAPLRLEDQYTFSKDELRLRIRIITPLRLKYRNRLYADLPFHVLTRAMLRRISSLMEHYGKGEPSLDYRGLVKNAEKIEVVKRNLSWFDWRRYSNRQDRGMLMGGLVGSIVYEGLIGPYLPLIRFCEKVHLGKQTTFGLGKFAMEVLE